ncbi:hypothetical protein LIER_39114 [Lithospermum erythrorhizon]|uniref:Uncharacterized protein n=1 Tax=Lithospermum erythrorhizon TaxID=34254 RepID=A0AAV3Q9T2_LITER
MDAEIIRELLGCRLTDEEATHVDLVEADLTEGLVGCEASVYVKVHSQKDSWVSTQGFNLAMSSAWNCKRLRVSRARGSLLHIFFLDEKVKESVGTRVMVRGLKEQFLTREVARKMGNAF